MSLRLTLPAALKVKSVYIQQNCWLAARWSIVQTNAMHKPSTPSVLATDRRTNEQTNRRTSLSRKAPTLRRGINAASLLNAKKVMSPTDDHGQWILSATQWRVVEEDLTHQHSRKEVNNEPENARFCFTLPLVVCPRLNAMTDWSIHAAQTVRVFVAAKQYVLLYLRSLRVNHCQVNKCMYVLSGQIMFWPCVCEGQYFYSGPRPRCTQIFNVEAKNHAAWPPGSARSKPFWAKVCNTAVWLSLINNVCIFIIRFSGSTFFPTNS